MSEFELWAWMSKDPSGWSQIGTVFPSGPLKGSPMQMTFRNLEMAMAYQDIAYNHGVLAGQEVRLIHFTGQPYVIQEVGS